MCRSGVAASFLPPTCRQVIGWRVPRLRPPCPQTKRGWEQAIEVGEKLHSLLAADGGDPSRLFCYTSPYLRCKQVGGVGAGVECRRQSVGCC